MLNFVAVCPLFFLQQIRCMLAPNELRPLTRQPITDSAKNPMRQVRARAPTCSTNFPDRNKKHVYGYCARELLCPEDFLAAGEIPDAHMVHPAEAAEAHEYSNQPTSLLMCTFWA